MEKLIRYHCGGGDGMYESKEGHYVDYSDYNDLLESFNDVLLALKQIQYAVNSGGVKGLFDDEIKPMNEAIAKATAL
jgi:hypothetical protein